jgi:acyl carrier protein
MTTDFIRAAVIASLAQLTGCAAGDISDSDVLIDDLGVDSLIVVNLLVAIEDRLDVQLPDGCEGSFVNIRTVGQLVHGFVTSLGASTSEREPSRVKPVAP